ncbi:unnamed protein product [Nezara viridula]|uniref:Succinate dehydrogenase assembly factor 2, mitochondrial n=1 Tax=Nezara viridula TaxID=85310 RepID=A0A9P0E9E0_NEZVI|nr:unnamed protein product [Nezara viridula]
MFSVILRHFRTKSLYKYGNRIALPVRNNLSSDTRESAGIFVPSYLPKPGETDGERRARLLYQSRKRGMLENDLLLSTFVDKYLTEMNDKLLMQYDKLINCSYSDWDIYYWLVGARPIPPEYDNEIMQLLIQHVENKKKERRLRQPDLPNYVFKK